MHNRVYCSHLTLGPIDRAGRRRLEVCGTFLGSTKTSDQFQCTKCKTWSKDHYLYCPCTGRAGTQQANAAQPTLDERTRGAEWQKCPNSTCGVVVERSTKCNHFECIFCQTSFCYICGSFADADSDHWFKICPRFGQPGDKYASFDEEYYFDSEEEGDEWNGESHQSNDDFDSEVQSVTFFGEPLIVPGPNASPLDQLQYDLKMLIMYQYDFFAETELIFGSLQDAPKMVEIFINLLYAFEANLRWADWQLNGRERKTAVDAVCDAVQFSNFRHRHDRLRKNMLATRDEALSWFDYNSVLVTNIPAKAFADVFERYSILHAPRFIWNAQAHHRAPGRRQKMM